MEYHPQCYDDDDCEPGFLCYVMDQYDDYGYCEAALVVCHFFRQSAKLVLSPSTNNLLFSSLARKIIHARMTTTATLALLVFIPPSLRSMDIA